MIPIRDVILYEDRAQITRKTTIQLIKGNNSICLQKISPLIVHKSIQVVLASSQAKVNFVDISRKSEEDVRIDHTRPKEQEKWRKEERTAKQEAENKARVYHRYRELYRRLVQEVFLEASWGQGNSEKWKSKEGTIRERKDQAFQEYEEATQAYTRIKNRNKASNVERMPKHKFRSYAQVSMEIYAPEEMETEISIHYIVPNACWRPSHQITLQNENIHFEIGAMLWQNTGIEWEEVNISLSTHRDSLGKAVPKLLEDKLQIRREELFILEEREQEIYETGTTIKVDKMPGIDDGGESRLLLIPKKESIPSNGKPYLAKIESFTTTTRQELMLIADQIPTVVRKTIQCNRSKIPILPGPVTLIKNSGYVGRSKVDFVAPNAEFTIGWGGEPDIRVRRVTECMRKDASFLQSKNKEMHSVQLFFSNIGDRDHEIDCVERIPVSEISQVQVESPHLQFIQDATVNFDKSNGFISWKQHIPKGAHITQKYFYSIIKDSSVVG